MGLNDIHSLFHSKWAWDIIGIQRKKLDNSGLSALYPYFKIYRRKRNGGFTRYKKVIELTISWFPFARMVKNKWDG